LSLPLLAASSSLDIVHQVPEGHVGAYWRGGALLKTITSPGFHFKTPFLTQYEPIQVTIQTDKEAEIDGHSILSLYNGSAVGEKGAAFTQVVVLLIQNHVLESIPQPIIGIKFRNSHTGGGPISKPPENRLPQRILKSQTAQGKRIVGEVGEGSDVKDSLDAKATSTLLAMGKDIEGLNQVRKGQGKDFSPQRMKMEDLVSNLVAENKFIEHRINALVNFSKLSLESCLSQIKLIEMLVGKEIIEHPKKKSEGDTSGGKRDRFQVVHQSGLPLPSEIIYTQSVNDEIDLNRDGLRISGLGDLSNICFGKIPWMFDIELDK
ncbi:hypothetical protein KI387_001876, partial [Taxus chinensis]